MNISINRVREILGNFFSGRELCDLVRAVKPNSSTICKCRDVCDFDEFPTLCCWLDVLDSRKEKKVTHQSSRLGRHTALQSRWAHTFRRQTATFFSAEIFCLTTNSPPSIFGRLRESRSLAQLAQCDKFYKVKKLMCILSISALHNFTLFLGFRITWNLVFTYFV